jgi:predicted RNase H-like HicB family nuclease
MIVAERPAIPGCVFQGRTEEEAMARPKPFARDWLPAGVQ